MTPMMRPSKVRNERSLCARMDPKETVMASVTFTWRSEDVGTAAQGEVSPMCSSQMTEEWRSETGPQVEAKSVHLWLNSPSLTYASQLLKAVTPKKAGVHDIKKPWIPVFARMTFLVALIQYDVRGEHQLSSGLQPRIESAFRL